MQNAPRRRRRTACFPIGGFALSLQFQIGITLLLLALAALFLLYPTSRRSVELADRQGRALHYARTELEEALQSDYSGLMLGERYSEYSEVREKPKGVEPPTVYRVRRRVTRPNSELQVKRIEVVVWWGADRSDGLRRVALCSAKGVYW